MYESHYKIKTPTKKCESFLSERPDSNGRPLAPHASMLANCTTPRFAKMRGKDTIVG
jgi:hypothetical protein